MEQTHCGRKFASNLSENMLMDYTTIFCVADCEYDTNIQLMPDAIYAILQECKYS